MNNITVLNIVIAKVWRGGEQYVYDTTVELSKTGNKVYIAVDINNGDMITKYSKIAEVIPCKLGKMGGLLALASLVKYIRKNNIKIINCHSGHAMLLCILLKKITKAKLVMFKHNALPSKSDCYHKWQRKNTDAYICVSQLAYNLQTCGL